jgi:redox-sensing transcriptional repressor
MKRASSKTIERISIYRRLLLAAKGRGQVNVYSHELAELVGGTAAQVRRDLMDVGCAGNSKKGYDVDSLILNIGLFLDNPDVEQVALVGVGNLGRALLQFFDAHHPKMKIVSAFETDPLKIGRVIHGCRCHPVENMTDVIRENKIQVAILAVPSEAAQDMAQTLESAGVTGILNFVPVPLLLHPNVMVENMDMTTALEKVVYLARQVRTKDA